MCSDFLTSAGVSISGTTVTLTCPADLEDTIKWFKYGENEPVKTGEKFYIITPYTDKSSGFYFCSYEEESGGKNHHFYIKAKGKCK